MHMNTNTNDDAPWVRIDGRSPAVLHVRAHLDDALDAEAWLPAEDGLPLLRGLDDEALDALVLQLLWSVDAGSTDVRAGTLREVARDLLRTHRAELADWCAAAETARAAAVLAGPEALEG